jgi:hypothetical protein
VKLADLLALRDGAPEPRLGRRRFDTEAERRPERELQLRRFRYARVDEQSIAVGEDLLEGHGLRTIDRHTEAVVQPDLRDATTRVDELLGARRRFDVHRG